MQMTFNGTGASEGFPALFCECEHCAKARTMDSKNFRMRSSCLIGESLLIDFSADTYARCLYGALNLTKVTDIIYTHSHTDHLYPADLVKIMPPFARHERKAPLRLYGNETVRNTMTQQGALSPKTAPYLDFSLLEPLRTREIAGYRITPLPAKHDPAQVCLIYLIEKDGTAILYGHDSGVYPEETWAALQGAHLAAAILDCTTGPHSCTYGTHMGIPENREVRRRMLEMGCAHEGTRFILTHFAHSGAPFYDDMEALAAENGFIAAHDGFVVDI